MGFFRRIRSYFIGTEIQEKSGRVKVKVEDIEGAKWISRGRYNYMKHHKVELEPNQRVFHLDGDCANDAPENLAAIRFSGKKYDLIESKVIFSPKPLPRPRPYVDAQKEKKVIERFSFKEG